MVTDVVTLGPGDSVVDAVSVLLEHDVGGVPVVDEEHRLMGMLSDSDLLVRQGRLHVPTLFTLFVERGSGFPPPSLQVFESELRKALGSTVGDLMDAAPPTCTEDETVEDVTTRMLDCGVRRLPVVRHGRLVGIVARGDLLRLLASGGGDGERRTAHMPEDDGDQHGGG